MDREVDVSRGSVISKDTNLAVYKKLEVSLLWMDDKQLEIGRDYLVKLGTKTMPGVVTKIKYAVDVNSGEHIATETLQKNGIAVCEILLSEPIAADVFESHRTLGELILIDRVSNMTSACGVVEKLDEKGGQFTGKASFKAGDLEARGDVFEEFYYDVESLSVLKYNTVGRTYTIGDEIPSEGKSYSYPDNFDIIVLRDNAAIKIRDKKVAEIIPESKYEYDDVPVINGRGFEIKIKSNDDLKKFFDEYSQVDDETKKEFFAKWMNFDTYRKVSF